MGGKFAKMPPKRLWSGKLKRIMVCEERAKRLFFLYCLKILNYDICFYGIRNLVGYAYRQIAVYLLNIFF